MSNCQHWFVLEILPEGGGETPIRVYLLEPSLYQFYRTMDLHLRPHFLANGLFFSRYEVGLYRERGLEEVNVSNLARGTSPLPEGVFVILRNNVNHILDEIQVINNLERGEETRALVDALRLPDLAELVLNNETAALEVDERGNLRKDINFVGRSSKDRIEGDYPGMNVPHYSTHFDDEPGLDGDWSLTQSLIKTAIAQRRLVLHLAELVGAPDWGMDFVGNEKRLRCFCHRIAQLYGITDYQDFVTAGNSLGINATVPGALHSLLARHKDNLNGRLPGHNLYWGVVVHARIMFRGVVVLVRINFGGYDRHHLDGVVRREEENIRILDDYRAWKEENPARFDPEPWRHIRDANPGTPVFTLPHANKIVYYSPFVDTLLKIGALTGWDRGVLYEAVLGMGMTPCAEGWCEGMLAAANPGFRKGRNLIVAFADYMVRTRGGVAMGEQRRRQPSLNMDEVDLHRLLKSARRMEELCSGANVIDDTWGVVGDWNAHDTAGGVLFAGELTAQEQVAVMSLVLEIRNPVHLRNARICKGTHTERRLRAEYGIADSEGRRMEVLRYVSARTGDPPVTVENTFCESNRVFQACDTFLCGMKIYDLGGKKDNELYATDEHGQTSIVPRPRWEWGRCEYNHGIKWWEGDGSRLKKRGGGMVRLKRLDGSDSDT